jgi:predicted AlkP superfamily phosphohydrolase/phosphomutase
MSAAPLAYIDPTGGLPPSSWGAVLAVLLAAAGAGLAALRLLGGRLLALLVRRRRALLAAACLLVLAGLTMRLWFGRSEPAAPAGPRVLVLAFDGLDPRLLEQYLREGRLPNFARLAGAGLYHPLPTCMAPQSPVAWCTCITGADAGAHGVFDFIKRDPASYRPDLALADRQKLTLPWRGTPFWERPALARLGTVAQRLPMVFPPPKLNGRLLAGMGVWDVRGTEGTYFFYSTAPQEGKEARGLLLPLRRDGAALHGELPGPYRAGESDDIREPFTLEPSGEGFTLRLQGKDYPLRAGRWSDWVSVRFGLGPLGLQKVPAITRVLPRAEGGHTTLYVAPLNFDPRAPLYPISHPRGYSAELAEAVGLFATRGMPFDTHALNDGVLADEDFLEQVRQVTDESEKMLHHELARFRSGLLFAYFEGSDIVQHLFWRGIDPKHPLHHDAATQRHRDAIPKMYEQYDAILGRAWAALGEGAAVVVMSDHGFGPFRRAVHLNALLRDLGLLVLKDGKATSPELLRDIDWYRTKAYALGFNTLYLNRAGREGKGIVRPEEAEQVLHVLTRALERWKDPGTGERPIKKVHRARELYRGKEHVHMPDLLVGYARGYRASWETALGAVPRETVEPNRKKWSGDHCVDASEVPGVFLSSDRTLDAATLADLGAALDRYLAARLAETPPSPK